MPRLPTGTVTFLFTDVEGSTRLLETLGHEYPRLLEEHARLIRRSVEETGGHEVGTEGDAFFLVFGSAPAAVAAAATIQKGLAALELPLRVRVGLHTGEGRLGGDDYVGLDVHRAARIAEVGHGGQVLLSQTTRDLVQDDLPPDCNLRDLGDHRLKDLSRPERLYQLIIAGLRSVFPSLRSLDAHPNNLPLQLTSFVGRERELAHIRKLLAENRLLTLTGPGGAGKTRVALQLAAEVSDEFEDGVFFVALASVHDPDLVASVIAQSLGLPEAAWPPPSGQAPGGGTRPAVERLLEYLRERELLLVLDNFEQVLPAAPVLTQLLEASPGLKVVVTSRAVLRLYGEHEFAVPPLELPDPRHLPDLPTLSQYEAVALFVQRATAVKPGFSVTNQNAPAIAEICARLDGLPLAIELAAARVRLLTPEAILARLGSRLRLLVGGARDLPKRQQTLREAIDWSYELLEPAEQRLFARLGVFVGGWSLEEAEAVCGPPEELGIEVFEGLSSLAEKSLVRVRDEDSPEPRSAMLETIREFALERLAASGEQERLRRRHAEAYLALAEQAEPELVGNERRRWLDRLERDHDNFRSALAWAIQQGEVETALRLPGAVWRLWQARGYLDEGRRWTEETLGLPGAESNPRVFAKALAAAGGIAHWRADVDGQLLYYQRYLEVARHIGDGALAGDALYGLGFPYVYRGEPEKTAASFEESRSLYEAAGDRLGVARVQWARATIDLISGDFETAAREMDRSLAVTREMGDRFLSGWNMWGLGMAAYLEGDFPTARAFWRRGLELFAEDRDHSAIVFHLESLASLAAAEGASERAARLTAAARALRVSRGTVLDDSFVARPAPEKDLGPETFAAAWAEGQAMTVDEAVSYALTA
ncbi:MAG: adenylate/guanylate cyclase domain-containing protein [Actinomycetota bacterium]|nr:adenylate/guanylate cyclase domain-containing protein [Actinomycetota bacterium]